jgi:hypothetical protein
VTNPVSTLQTDLDKLATPDTNNPSTGSATPSAALTNAGELLSLLATNSLVGSDISQAVSVMYNAIHDAISNDAVAALQKIAGEIAPNSTLGNLPAGDISDALTSLQNALQTAQSLMPGGSSAAASALASTTQFATLFGNLLSGLGKVSDASNTIYEIAQQLEQIADTFHTAAAGIS